MSATEIEWAGWSWNPVIGCSPISPGCAHCYAARTAARMAAMAEAQHRRGRNVHKLRLYAEVTADGRWNGQTRLDEEALALPLRRQKPTIFFVDSMGDLFHETARLDWLDRVFAVAAAAPQHTYLVLTKRAATMATYFRFLDPEAGGEALAGIVRAYCAIPPPAEPRAEGGTSRDTLSRPAPGCTHAAAREDHAAFARGIVHNLRNSVYVGASIENQAEAAERLPYLRDLAAAGWRVFASAEPLLGPLDLGETAKALRVVIAGGETGPAARPCHPDWLRSLRDQCAAAGTPFFFKQWGEWQNGSATRAPNVVALADGSTYTHDLVAARRIDERHRGSTGSWAPGLNPTCMARTGRKAAGHTLDGTQHRAKPW